MAAISEALAIAVQHHQAGRLQAAEQIYRQILAVDPCHADALHLLGVIAFRTDRHEAAIEYIRRAIGLKGTEAAFHSNLGMALKHQGMLREAVASYRRALELKPELAEVHNNLANALKDQGDLEEAVASYRRALELKPDYAEAHYNLANAFKDQEKLEEAVASYGRALELKPDYADAHNNLGDVFKEQGKVDEAVVCFRRALEHKPDLAEAHYNLANVFKDRGELDEAVASYRRTLGLKPDFAEAHYHLANAFKDRGQLDEAIASYRRALELKPDFAEAHSNMGNVFKDRGELGEAVVCYGRALELRPDLAKVHNNLGNAFSDQRKLNEAVGSYRRALELKPDYAEASSNLLLTLQYQAGATLSDLAVAHAEYDRLHAAPFRSAWRPHENDRDPQRRLRLGFVSPDFGQHPVGYFLIRALENLDQGQWQTVCYCDRITKDDLTARFQAAATTWRDVYGLTDKRLAERIRADQIDILFDLAGHSARNRLLVFARKPAPIQVTWAGYVGTTGLTAMDYILADRYEIPPDAEVHYRERVLRMPDGYVCYDPPPYALSVSTLPALKQGYVTFGSFNNPTKITSPVVETWAKILDRVPQSRLVLKYKGMSDVSIAKGLAEEFASHKIDPRRIECLGHSHHARLLEEYNRIDLALDPFPYNGGLTTCEALWMGVPVVTCPGETFASRHSLSHLSNAGLTDTIAHDLDDYVEVAVSLASDLPGLAVLRAELRKRMVASPLQDGKRFAANLTCVLRDVWREWCHEGGV